MLSGAMHVRYLMPMRTREPTEGKLSLWRRAEVALLLLLQIFAFGVTLFWLVGW